MQKVMLIGNLGRDPDVKYSQQGTAIAQFSVATTERWKDKGGELQEHRSVRSWPPVLSPKQRDHHLSSVCCEVMVDSLAMAKVEGRKRQRRSIAEKRRIVELAMQPGASIARVAREHGVNANMVHYWRKLYRQGRLGEKKTDSVRLLPVRVSEAQRVRWLNP